MAQNTGAMNKRVYWLARVLWPDLIDIAYDQWVGYVIRFPNRYGSPCPQIRIGGFLGDLQYIWDWLVEQVKFRELTMLARVLA